MNGMDIFSGGLQHIEAIHLVVFASGSGQFFSFFFLPISQKLSKSLVPRCLRRALLVAVQACPHHIGHNPYKVFQFVIGLVIWFFSQSKVSCFS